MRKASIEEVSFIAVVALVTMAFVWLLWPYYGAVLWATIVALLFYPLHRKLQYMFGGRRNLAAAVSVLCFICIVLIPGSIVLGSLADEAARLHGRIRQREFDALLILQQIRDALPSPVVNAMGALQFGDLEQIQSRLASSFGQVVQKFASVMKATVKGNVIIASIQGTIRGLTFWLIGIEPALLWGALMALLSLLPAIGAGVVAGIRLPARDRSLSQGAGTAGLWRPCDRMVDNICGRNWWARIFAYPTT